MSKMNLIDQLFYRLETAGMAPILMGGAIILDPATAPQPLDADMLVEHIAARMGSIALMRKKIVQDSLHLGTPQLLEDPDFDVYNHISVTQLKAPGGYKEFTEYLGNFSSESLDLTKPLWHYEVVSGLEGGKFAVTTHIHHALIDGVGAQKAMASLFDLKPVKAERINEPQNTTVALPKESELLVSAVAENARRFCFKAPRFVAKHTPLAFQSVMDRMPFGGKTVTTTAPKVSKVHVPKVNRTSINVSQLSNTRAVAYAEYPFAEVKALAAYFDCTVNDIVLLMNSVALEHYFEVVGEEIDFDLVCGMPINMRADDDSSGGNALSVARLSLRNQIEDPKARLQAIMRDTRKIKDRSRSSTKPKKAGVDNNALVELFSPMMVEALTFGIYRLDLMSKATLVNVGITNVPGSQIPLYIGGAKQVAVVPMAPTGDTIGLTITISSTDAKLVLGFHGCGEAIVDKEALVAGANRGFEALQKIVSSKK